MSISHHTGNTIRRITGGDASCGRLRIRGEHRHKTWRLQNGFHQKPFSPCNNTPLSCYTPRRHVAPSRYTKCLVESFHRCGKRAFTMADKYSVSPVHTLSVFFTQIIYKKKKKVIDKHLFGR